MIDPVSLGLLSAGSAIAGAASSFFGSRSASRGADQAAALAERNRALQEQATKQQINYLAPYRDVGYGAQNDLATIYGQDGTGSAGDLEARRRDLEARFQDSPEYRLNYQANVDEASRGIERNASAAGLRNSGRTLEALGQRAGNISNQLFGSYTTGLFKLAGSGQEAVNSGNSAIKYGAAAQGNALGAQAGAYQDKADARTAGILGAGNAVQNSLSSFARIQGQQGQPQNRWFNPDTGRFQ